ncbi:MAG: LysM peptidoglycan-binding domain-containing protein [Ferruginibacter sp.]|nr:LysM peptidoglycan-binding domain-containing protein [Ferruginibacter sp.]
MRFISTKLSRVCLSMMVFLGAGNIAGAATDPVVTKPILGSQGQFLVNTESYAKDIKYFSLSVANRNAIQNNSILNMVGVGIDEQSNYYIRSNFSVTVTLQITTYDNNESATGTYNKTFTVNYDTAAGAKYKSLDYTTYSNAFALRAKIISIDSGNVNWPVSNVLKVENQLTATRDYLFNCNLALDGINTTLSASNNELATAWTQPSLDNNAGVTEYDLEWAWIDEGAIAGYKNGNNFVQDLIFTNNATRVSISGSSYNIPLLYDDTGRIFIRVRPVQLRTDGQRIEGKWSWILNDANQPAESSNPVFYAFYGHEDKLNWQVSTGFAEEGKRKSVIQYFDGSLRSRQTVTKDNTSNTTVVAESFYDYQGRAVLQVLPAPTLNTAIAYVKNFNQAIGYNEYPKSVYDKLDAGATVCGNPAKPFNTDFGTANYYSAKNPMLPADALAKYIPDATATNPNEAWSFTETRLSPDGRVAAQGGVGITHQLGSGHETKYYYESPAQEELDALFGTDVGVASHYFKNMVKDANGQFSVSYMDMHGRTIATALAGESPKNADGSLMLDTLESKNEQLFTKQLIDRETNIEVGNSIISSKPIVVLKDNSTYSFDYSLSPKQLSLISCSNNQPVCYDCLYQLKFTISSDCDNQIVYADSMINFTLGQYISQCNANGNSAQGFTKHFDKVLNQGSYTVTKTLTLSSEAQIAYGNNFLQTDTCKKLVDFYSEELTLLQSTGNCVVNCASCKAALGNNLIGFIAKFAYEMGVPDSSLSPQTIAQLTASFNEAMANCDRICNDTNRIDLVRSTREMMLQDVTPPYGQYARNDAAGITKAYNIFNANDPLNSQSGYGITTLQGHYKQPRKFNDDDITLAPNAQNYFDEFGAVESINQYLPNLSPQQFVDSFKTPWANQLLVHHPEFRKLQLTENQLKPSYEFEAALEKDSTWAQAASIHPLYGGYRYITNLIDADPFFNGVGTAYKQRMITGRYNGNYITNPPPTGNALNTDPVIYGIAKYTLPHNQISCSNPPQFADSYVSMWQVALGTVFCRDKADPVNPCIVDYSDINTKAGCTMNPAYAQPQNTFNEGCPTDRDWAWKIFKTLYLAERRKLISAYLNQNDNHTNFTPGTNGIPNYQRRFINHANPSAVFDNLGIAGSGDIGAIISTAGNNLTLGNQQANTLAEHQYDTVCRGYANVWISQLKNCPEIAQRLNNPAYWTSDSTWLVTNLVAVCRKGSDNNHYLGSSSVSPVNENTITINGIIVNSFEDVIRIYMDKNSPYPAVPHPTSECYEWLISTPQPYDRQKALTNSYVLTKPTPCECQRIGDLRTEWDQAITNGTFAGTFSAYMQYRHGTYISNEQLDAITALCNGTYQCRMLEKPIVLPPALQCPSSHPNQAPKTCISCADYNDIKTAFNSLTGQQAPYVNPQNTTEVNWNYAFAGYANHQTGFTKTWMEYVAFQNTCNATTPTISCGSLDSTLNEFLASPEYLANPVGLSCIQAFVNYFNNHYNVVYTYAGWQQQYALSNCNFPNVCKPKITCTGFTALINGFYNQNTVQVFQNGNCQNLFVTYINTQLSSNYTYAQLEAIYRYTCKGECELNVCGFPNAFLLTKVVNDFKAANPQPWNLPDCRTAFAGFFNDYFGLPWNGIAAYDFDAILNKWYGPYIMLGCVPDISTICDPPYTCTDLRKILKEFIALNSPVEQLPDCQQAFADYFNLQMGTNYTYAQIALLYEHICGSPLTVCQVSTDCKTIVAFAEAHPIQSISSELCHQEFLQLFNAYFGTNYTSWDDLYKLYHECGYDLDAVCKGCTLVADCEMLKDFVKEFKSNYPDPSTQLGNKCQSFFAARFNERFGTDFTYTEIATYYLQQCNAVLDVCTSSCLQISEFINGFAAQYGSLKLPAAAREDLFVFAYNYAFLKGANENAGTPLEVTGDNMLVMGAEQNVKDPKAFDPLISYPDIQKVITGCGLTLSDFTPAGTITLYDPQVLLSLKQVYYIIHPAGLPDNCQAGFAGWFNSVMQTQYEYNDLLELYNSVCGNNAGYICDPPVDDGKQASVYVDIIGITVPGNLPPMLCGLNEPGSGPVTIDDDPCKDLPKIAFHFAQERYELYVDSLRNVFDSAYRSKCMAAKDLESFTVTYKTSEYHYTLYYYDQAGNLVKTVPPAGVNKLSGNDLTIVKNYRASILNGQPESSGNQKVPAHTLVTQYRYNTLNQVVAQVTPDAGISKFYYDRLGRLVVSQNAKQTANSNYSYTLYDDFGRIKEVGQLNTGTAITQATAQSQSGLAAWLNNKPAEQITRTFYDKSYIDGQGTLCPQYLCQTNLRNRVSYTAVYATGVPGGTGEHTAATYYSYDIHGNVYELLQDYGNSSNAPNAMNSTGNRFKKIAYNYDLISGKVNSVSFQANQADAFYHRYSYDAENKLILVETSSDKIVWERDARYNYYKHGPLARTRLGELEVQGLDYAYTLQGWLKGVNSTAVSDGSFDIGRDGKAGSVNSLVARDVYGFSLNYFNGDYKQIDPAVSSFTGNTFGLINADGNKVANSLYNGNIAAMLVNIPKIGTGILYGYKYDQLNRIRSMDAFTGLNNSANTFTAVTSQNYKERITYDANGNIKTYLRNGDAARQAMDNMTYSYKANTNQLDKVIDAADDDLPNYSNYNDIKQGQQNGNYQYDAIGNLIADASEGITNINWNVYGKIQEITKNSSLITYGYDAGGNRISKAAAGKTTWYVRDATGNVMSVYTVDATVNSGHLTQSEVHLYGSSRLGIWNVNKDITVAPDTNFIRGNKSFELSNHLSNILATISDKKLQVQNGTTGIIDHYEADITTANDYYPFGTMMPSRKYDAGTGYRYGFGGQEADNEIYGQGNVYTAEFWEYDPRLGRRWNVDPISKPWESPYVAFNDNPIARIDPKGLDGEPYKVKKGDNLTKIAKRFNTTVGNLQKLNNLKDANKIQVGQSILTSGSNDDEKSKTAAFEANFTTSPFTSASNNPTNSKYVTNEVATVKSLAEYTFSTTISGTREQENTMVVGGPLLEEIKRLPSVHRLIQKGASQMFNDGKFTPGEFFTGSYQMGNLSSPDGDRMKSQVFSDLLSGKKITESRLFSAEFWLGSYDFSMRVSNDGKNMIITVYDNKSAQSATDRNWFIKTFGPIPDIKTTYQRYLWIKPIK